MWITQERRDHMRRRLFLSLVVLGVLALGVKFLTGQGVISERNPGGEMRFVEYSPLTPQGTAKTPATQLQNSVDRVSEASLNGQWITASRAVQQLSDSWERFRPTNGKTLTIENDIENTIQTLRYNVWGQDQEGVLMTAQKLTGLISQLGT